MLGSAVSWLHDSGLFPRGRWPCIRPGALRAPSGLPCVPTLFGLGTPHWEARRHAHLIGLTADTTPEDIGEAALLGIAQQVANAVDGLAGPAAASWKPGSMAGSRRTRPCCKPSQT